MLYDISLTIAYDYVAAADASRHLVMLVPADLPGEQRLVAGSLNVTPGADERLDETDFFGNRRTELVFDHPHHEFVFAVQSRIERIDGGQRLDISPRLSALAGEVVDWRSLDALSPHHFAGTSPRVRPTEATAAYAREAAGDGGSVFEAVVALGRALNRDMRFDPKATTVETPFAEAFERRRGVCQDFSHIMIACLRGIGIPAGYVSGYLRTIPPKGKPRLEGADAMHAWVRAWCGADMGWVEYDPTNALLVGADHVVVARGRDYSDVAPVKGVSRTAGAHTSKHSVDVVPVA